MTAALVIAGLAALLGATATSGAVAFAYAIWKDSNATKSNWLDSEDNRRRLLADKGALTQQLADRDATLGGLRAANADLADRLKVAEARAVHGLSDDELRNALDRRAPAPVAGGVPPCVPVAAAVPGHDAAGPARALPDSAVAPVVGGTSR